MLQTLGLAILSWRSDTPCHEGKGLGDLCCCRREILPVFFLVPSATECIDMEIPSSFFFFSFCFSMHFLPHFWGHAYTNRRAVRVSESRPSNLLVSYSRFKSPRRRDLFFFFPPADDLVTSLKNPEEVSPVVPMFRQYLMLYRYGFFPSMIIVDPFTPPPPPLGRTSAVCDILVRVSFPLSPPVEDYRKGRPPATSASLSGQLFPVLPSFSIFRSLLLNMNQWLFLLFRAEVLS